MTKTLFGGSKNVSQSTNASGFRALPSDLQSYFRDIAQSGEVLIEDPSQYFSPIGLTSEEQLAASMVGPEGFQAGVSQYLNPFREYITEDINRAFEDPSSMLKAQADEAGAFGGSRYRKGQSDLEEARLRAIAASQGEQFNQAANQYQQGISNLLGIGSLERGVDLAQRQALPAALSSYMDILAPLLSSSTGSNYGKSFTEGGFVPAITGFFRG
ncbi:MAG: hypothetical protein Unbinned5081contig1002_46 [Prokaryotic dsDNA virus sp.]|nr:MAG: hypothetical protein Unbinned5081contig1002_46 [Prokaryotic dsDNA virus sp.]|tara:strand:+ start:23301 stop:23942 length:642 start_codon:yes stop_codon:yes gene_type:complete